MNNIEEFNANLNLSYLVHKFTCFSFEEQEIQRLKDKRKLHDLQMFKKDKLPILLNKLDRLLSDEWEEIICYLKQTDDLDTFLTIENSDFLKCAYTFLDMFRMYNIDKPKPDLHYSVLPCFNEFCESSRNDCWMSLFILTKHNLPYKGLNIFNHLYKKDTKFFKSVFYKSHILMHLIENDDFNSAQELEQKIIKNGTGIENINNTWNHILDTLWDDVEGAYKVLYYFMNKTLHPEKGEINSFFNYRKPSWHEGELHRFKVNLIFSHILHKKVNYFFMSIPEVKNNLIESLREDFSICRGRYDYNFFQYYFIDFNQIKNKEGQNFIHYWLKEFFKTSVVHSDIQEEVNFDRILESAFLHNYPNLFLEQDTHGKTPLDEIKGCSPNRMTNLRTAIELAQCQLLKNKYLNEKKFPKEKL